MMRQRQIKWNAVKRLSTVCMIPDISPQSFLSLWLMGDGSPLPLKASQGPYRQNWDHGHAQWPRSYVSLCCPVNTVCPIHLLPQTPHRKVLLLWDDSTNQCSTMSTTMTPHCHAKLAITLIQIPGRTPHPLLLHPKTAGLDSCTPVMVVYWWTHKLERLHISKKSMFYSGVFFFIWLYYLFF